MTLVLLPNNITPSVAKLYVTDGTNAETTDTAGLFNVTGGAPNLSWSSNTGGARKLVYVNKLGGLGATHVVMTGANLFSGKAVAIQAFSVYFSSNTNAFLTASFAETLVGKNTTDWVCPVSLSNQQGIAVVFTTTSYTKVVHKFYVSSGQTFSYPGLCTCRYLPFPSRHIYLGQAFLVDAEWEFFFDAMTSAEIDQFESTPNLLSEPLFLYDANGYQIPHKLIHGIIADYKVRNIHDDTYQLGVKLKELRQWV